MGFQVYNSQGQELQNLTGSAGGDLTGTYPNPDIAAGAIVNADVNASAAIAQSKLETVSWLAVGSSGNAAFTNSWVNYGLGYQAARYRKINDMVYIEGLVKTGASGNSVFTLPSGYRPNGTLIFATVMSVDSFAVLYINTGGTVVPYGAGVGTYCSINCSFSVTA